MTKKKIEKDADEFSDDLVDFLVKVGLFAGAVGAVTLAFTEVCKSARKVKKDLEDCYDDGQTEQRKANERVGTEQA